MDYQEKALWQTDSDEISNQYLTFWADGQLFGISIVQIRQIIGMQEITPLPDSPRYVKGIVSLRGEIFPVIDVRLRLNRPQADYNERTCIITVELRESSFGFIVDEVDEVCHIAQEQISPPPCLMAGQPSADAYLAGIARLEEVPSKKEKVVLILDMTRLLREDVFDQISSAAQL